MHQLQHRIPESSDPEHGLPGQRYLSVTEVVEAEAEDEDCDGPGDVTEAEGEEDKLPVPALALRHVVTQQDKDEHLAGEPY